MDDDLDLGATLKGFSPGQKLSDRYALERILGKGGMGVVWLVKDEELKREIAMKFLPEIVIRDREATADLKRETRRSLELTHANIVRIYDFVQGPNWAGITMERIDGETLSALKVDEPGGCFDVERISGWIEQLCLALSYAHDEARVVHRDLKPSNLMLTKNGRIKVADFGIAGTLTESMSRVSVRPTTSGTLVYMSPQQAMGEPPSVTDDIYSLGATIYDLLTGKPPFYSGDVIRQLREKEPAPMMERRSGLQITGKQPIPEKWESAVMACLRKDAAQRPQSVAEFAKMLFGPASPAAKRVAVSPPAKKQTPAPKQPSQSQAPPSKTGLAVAVAGIVLIGIVALAIHFHGGGKKTDTGGGTVTSNASPTASASASPAPAVAQNLEALDAAKLEQLAQGGNAEAQGLLALWDGLGFKTRQDYKQAFTWATSASNAGNPVGQYSLGAIYWWGAGVAQNLGTANSMAAKAIEGFMGGGGIKTPDATNYCLAGAYEGGLGAPKNPAQAQALFQQESDKGYAPAQFSLGCMYAGGEAGSRDWPQALALFQKAADQGLAVAMLHLAMMYDNGQGVMEDQQKALSYWQQAAAQGNPIAEENMGRMYRSGDGVQVDMAKALAFYQAAADQGDAQAICGLAWMYANGEGVTADPGKAAALTQQAALIGYSPVRADLTLLYAGAATTEPSPLDPLLVGTWVASPTASQSKTLRWQLASTGKYTISGLFGDNGVAGGSDGSLLVMSSAGNGRAQVTYAIHGDTLDTYGPLGPAEWHRQKATSSDTANDSSTKRNSSSSNEDDSSTHPSTGNQILNGYMKSRGYGGYGGYGY